MTSPYALKNTMEEYLTQLLDLDEDTARGQLASNARYAEGTMFSPAKHPHDGTFSNALCSDSRWDMWARAFPHERTKGVAASVATSAGDGIATSESTDSGSTAGDANLPPVDGSEASSNEWNATVPFVTAAPLSFGMSFDQFPISTGEPMKVNTPCACGQPQHAKGVLHASLAPHEACLQSAVASRSATASIATHAATARQLAESPWQQQAAFPGMPFLLPVDIESPMKQKPLPDVSSRRHTILSTVPCTLHPKETPSTMAYPGQYPTPQIAAINLGFATAGGCVDSLHAAHASPSRLSQSGDRHLGQPGGHMQSKTQSAEETLRTHLQELQLVSADRVVLVRRINRLGFQSAKFLKTHYSQYGVVDRVLVSHSHVKSQNNRRFCTRLRPSSLGFVVMSTEEAVSTILSEGPEQVVKGGGALRVPIRVQSFKPRSVMEAMEDSAEYGA